MLQSIKTKQRGEIGREIYAFETLFEQQQQTLQFKNFSGNADIILTKKPVRIILNTVS